MCCPRIADVIISREVMPMQPEMKHQEIQIKCANNPNDD